MVYVSLAFANCRHAARPTQSCEVCWELNARDASDVYCFGLQCLVISNDQKLLSATASVMTWFDAA